MNRIKVEMDRSTQECNEKESQEKRVPIGLLSFVSMIFAYVLYALLNRSTLVSIFDRTATLETIIDFFIRGALWGMGAGMIIWAVATLVYVVFATDYIKFKEK